MSGLTEFAAGFLAGNPAQKLTDTQNAAMLKWPADAAGTHCNSGLIDICHAFNCRSFDGLMASEIVRKCQESEIPGWCPCSWMEAAEWAKRGNLAFLGWANPTPGGHGHVASVAARDMTRSPSWGIPVCVVANIGKHNDFMLASAAFSESMRPGIKAFRFIS